MYCSNVMLHTRMHARTHVHARTYACTHTHTHIHTYTHTYTHIQTHMCVRTFQFYPTCVYLSIHFTSSYCIQKMCGGDNIWWYWLINVSALWQKTWQIGVQSNHYVIQYDVYMMFGLAELCSFIKFTKLFPTKHSYYTIYEYWLMSYACTPHVGVLVCVILVASIFHVLTLYINTGQL